MQMNLRVYNALQQLHTQYGPREFGKLSQKVLAIAYLYAGYNHVVERAVQGVDIDAANGAGLKFATEVKTTTSEEIIYETKDQQGLSARSIDGYRPVLACLWLSPLSNWFFAEAECLRVGPLSQDCVRPYRLRDLELQIVPHFDHTLLDNMDGIKSGAQSYLDSVLRKLGAELLQ
jgi:hypothetical protein